MRRTIATTLNLSAGLTPVPRCDNLGGILACCVFQSRILDEYFYCLETPALCISHDLLL